MSEGFEVRYVWPDRQKAIFLELCSAAPRPEYFVTGKTQCMRCEQWCWLGTETLKVVQSGAASPFCVPCGETMGAEHDLKGFEPVAEYRDERIGGQDAS